MNIFPSRNTGSIIPPDQVAAVQERFLGECKPVASPALYCMAGIPGAGKTSFVSAALKSGQFPENAFLLDPDRVMDSLPGYRRDVETGGPEKAWRKWEMPARDLAYTLFDRAKEKRLNIIKDMGCARDENYRKITDLKQAGYKIHIFYIACDMDEAQRRCTGRERFMPPALVHERYKSLLRLLPDYRNIADSFTHFDNTDLLSPFRKAA